MVDNGIEMSFVRTKMTKEASNMILANFRTICIVVGKERSIYNKQPGNLHKVNDFFSNIGEYASIFLIVQILVNLLPYS